MEIAEGGTLFLDEIGEMPLDLQVRMLRLLQQHEIEKVGAMMATRVDVRIIAATHRDLEALVAEGRFREDLYYRLAVIPITVPRSVSGRETWRSWCITFSSEANSGTAGPTFSCRTR